MSMYAQGDVVIVDFEPSRGHEPRKSRPALVVSTFEFNVRSSLTYVAPITSVRNSYPLHVPIVDVDRAGVEGDICLEAIAAKDLGARSSKRVGRLATRELCEVLNLIAPIFGL